MVGQSAATVVKDFPAWHLLFAREPDPDLDFEENLEEADELVHRGVSDRPPNKPSRARPVVIVLLLLVVAGGGYLAMNPEILLDFLGPEMTEPPAPHPAPRATTAPNTLPGSTPEQPSPALPLTSAPTSSPSVPPPLFGEGQRVTVKPDPASPTGLISLSGDAAGTRPGPSINTGATLTVLDAELQNNIWIYAVRTEEGTTGWIAEHRLAAQ